MSENLKTTLISGIIGAVVELLGFKFAGDTSWDISRTKTILDNSVDIYLSKTNLNSDNQRARSIEEIVLHQSQIWHCVNTHEKSDKQKDCLN